MYAPATVSVKLISFSKLCFPSRLNLLTELRAPAESLRKFSECTPVTNAVSRISRVRNSSEQINYTRTPIRADPCALTRANEHHARGKERSMESGIIANVDRLKETREEEILYLTYVTSDHGGVSCLRPRPEEGERREPLPLSSEKLPAHRSLSSALLVAHDRHRSP